MEKKKYKVILADPPWPIKWGGGTVGLKNLSYNTMTIAEIAEMPIKEITDHDCMLYMWTTNAFLPEALGIVRIWGFEYKGLWTWCKNNGMGGHPRNATEQLIIAQKGNIKSIGRHEKATLNWFEHPRLKHSEKPEYFRQKIKDFTPEPRLELFARTKTDGFDAFGNQINSDVFILTHDLFSNGFEKDKERGQKNI